MNTSISDALRDAGSSSVFWIGLAIVLAMAIVGYLVTPYGQKIKTVEKAGSYPSWRSLAARRPLRFLGRSNGAHRGSAGTRGGLWSGHVSWPTSPGRWTR